ncbi:MAG: Zn-dependent hydrolase [Desulfobacteraceae bacterium]|jgi:allantoate deiminase
MAAQIKRIQKDIDFINSCNASPEKGITRQTFSVEYLRAVTYVVDEMKQIGARISYCLGGNIRARLSGTNANGPAVMMGSHLDTVVHGGRFDGVVGVVAAVEAARIIMEEKISHRLPIDVVVFAEEEGSRFNWGLLGSSIWTGRLDHKRLENIKDSDGVTYPEAMVQAGFEVSDESLLEPQKLRAMLEVHIEQGAVLEKQGYRIGLVEAIVGIQHLDIIIHGRADHAGTTPMDDRSDALQAAARIIAAVEEIAQDIGANTVATVGRIICEPGQVNVIPGRVTFSLDVRSSHKTILESAVTAITGRVKDICGERNLEFEITQLGSSEPVLLSGEIVDLIGEKAREKNIEPLRMVSGAGHDTALLADLTEAGMIFVPSQKGRSHCPQEFTRLEDICLGCEVLLETALALAAS